MRSDWKRPSEYSLPGEGERRVMLRIAYDGSFFHGWQSQDNAPSVQNTLSETLSLILGRDTVAYASGRTDSGVHALGQVCHFDTDSGIADEKFRIILNTRLPRTIRVISSETAPEGFHARYSTMSREYWYLCKDESMMLPQDDRHMTPLRRMPDIALLRSYASHLQGTHDFTTFASARDVSESRVRDIYVSDWDLINDVYGFPVLRYRTAGNAFLYHQVRSMAGTMIECALMMESEEAFQSRLLSCDRSKALRTASPYGLYLADVSYDEERYRWFEERNG